MVLNERSWIGSLFIASLLLVVFCAVAPGGAAAAQDGDFTYTTSGNPLVATVTGYTGAGGAVVIPATLGGYRVVAIGTTAFADQSSITSVVMADSITSIAQQGFYWCYYITSITLSQNLTSIGGWAFDGCNHLTSITFPASLTNISEYAFQQCPNLQSITFRGMTAPANVSDEWVSGTNATLRGHAYVGSNFPAPGSSFHGLMMGTAVPTAPSAPTGLTTTPGNSQATLTWVAPGSDGGSPVTNYRLYRSSSSSGTYSLLASPMGLTYTDTGLTNGQTYWYKVTAVNSVGESGMSTQTSAALAGGTDNSILYLGVIIAIIAAAAMVVVYLTRRRK